MNKPLLAAIAGIGILGTAAGAYVIASPGGGEEEVAQQVATATPSASAPATATLPPLPSATPVLDLTLTYTDATYDYSFQYPATWIISPAKTGGELTALYSYDPASVPPAEAGTPVSADRVKIELRVAQNSKGLSLEDWLAEQRASGAPVLVTSRSSISVDGAEGIVEIVEGAEGGLAAQHFLSKGNRIYIITKYPSASILSGAFDAILATFRFNLAG